MPTCSFCKKNYDIPRGLTVFQLDGTALYFCSSKCRRNLKLKRDPKKTNWVKRSVKVKEKVERVERQEVKPEKIEEKVELVKEKPSEKVNEVKEKQEKDISKNKKE